MANDGLAPVEHDFRIWLKSQKYEPDNDPIRTTDFARQAFYSGWLSARHYSEQYLHDFGVVLSYD